MKWKLADLMNSRLTIIYTINSICCGRCEV